MIEAVGKLYGVSVETLTKVLGAEICSKLGPSDKNRSSMLHEKISQCLSKLGIDNEVKVSPFGNRYRVALDTSCR